MLKRIRARELSHAAGYAVGVGGFEVFLRDLFLLLWDGSEQEVTEIAQAYPAGAAPV